MELVRSHFHKADLDGDMFLEFDELRKLFKNMNIKMQGQYLEHIFKKFDKDNNGRICQEEFHQLFNMLMIKESLSKYFEQYSIEEDGDKIVPFHMLRNFLTDYLG